MTSALLIALYVGLAVPVIGAGIALSLGASAPDTVLGFAILVGLGVAASGWALLGRGNHQDPVTTSHLTGGEPGSVAKTRTAASDPLRRRLRQMS